MSKFLERTALDFHDLIVYGVSDFLCPPNDFKHILQLNSVGFSWTYLIWNLSEADCSNETEQTWQGKGLNFSWTICMLTFIAPFCPKFKEHIWHWKTLIFWWTILLLPLKVLFSSNNDEHTWALGGGGYRRWVGGWGLKVSPPPMKLLEKNGILEENFNFFGQKKEV